MIFTELGKYNRPEKSAEPHPLPIFKSQAEAYLL